jgi:hypothetical protein
MLLGLLLGLLGMLKKNSSVKYVFVTGKTKKEKEK